MTELGEVTPANLYQRNRVADSQLSREEMMNALRARRDPKNIPEPPEVAPETPPEPKQSEDDEGFLSGAMDLATFFIRPLTAFGEGGLAPMAHDYQSESIPGKIGEAFTVSGKAFRDALFPTYGEDVPFYGREIMDKYFPDASDTVKNSVGMVLELVADPTVILPLGAVKTFQLGSRTMLTRANPASGPGVWESGLRSLFGFSQEQSIEELTETTKYMSALGGAKDKKTRDLLRLAAAADSGNEKAKLDLLKALDSETVANATRKKNAIDFDKVVGDIEKVIGNPTEAPLNLPMSAAGAQDIANFRAASQAHRLWRPMKINIAAINDLPDIDHMVDNVKATVAGLQSGVNRPEWIAKQNALLQDLVGGRKIVQHEGYEAFAIRQLMLANGEELRSLAKIVSDSGTSSPTLDFALQKRLYVQKLLNERAVGLKPNASLSALKSLTIHSRTSVGKYQEYQRIFPNIKESIGFRRQLKELIKATDNGYQVNRIVERAFRANIPDVMYEVWINSILSGPITHAINITSNAYNMMYAPSKVLLQGMSAGARGDFQRSKQLITESQAMMGGMMAGIRDIVKLMSRHGAHTVQIPEELKRLNEVYRMRHIPKISSEALGREGQLGAAIDYVGRLVRLPGEALLREDLAFKLIHYRMATNRAAMTEAMKHSDPKVANAIYEYWKRNPSEAISSDAINMASYYTFTNELGSKGKTLQAVSRWPGVRWLIPFVQTPTNIVKFGLRHSFLGNIAKDFKDVYKLTPAGDTARAQVALGTLIPASIIASLGDNITGYINVESPEGRFKQAKGMPAYSIRFGDKWYSYERIEPLRTVLGLMVSYKDIVNNLDLNEEADQSILEQATWGVIAPFLRVIGGNYMMPQLESLFYAIEGIQNEQTDYSAGQFNRILSTMFVPNLFSQTNKALFDPVFRDAEGFIQALMARVPGLSQDLPGHRDLWGDEAFMPPGLGPDIISPIPVRPDAQDPIDAEIIRVGAKLPQAKKDIEGVKLTNIQREQFAIYVGKGWQGVPPLKDAVARVMDSQMYQKLGDEGRATILEMLVKQRREGAKQYMMMTDKDLQSKVLELRREKALMMRPQQ